MTKDMKKRYMPAGAIQKGFDIFYNCYSYTVLDAVLVDDVVLLDVQGLTKEYGAASSLEISKDVQVYISKSAWEKEEESRIAAEKEANWARVSDKFEAWKASLKV